MLAASGSAYRHEAERNTGERKGDVMRKRWLTFAGILIGMSISGQSNAKRLQQLMNVQVSGLNDRELVQQIKGIVEISKNYGKMRFHIYVFPMVLFGFKLKLLIRMSRLKRPVSEYELLSNLDYKTAVIEKALNALAASADLNPVLRAVFLECPAGEVQHRLELESEGQAFLKEVEAFLQEHGARTMKAYMPFSNEASWSENVSSLYGTIAAMLRSGNIHNFDKRQEDINLQFYNLTEEIRKGLPRFLADSFSRTLEQFRAAFKGREWTLYAIEECYVALRKAMREAADRLTHRGFLTAPEDILYLKLSEVYQLLDRSSGEAGMEDAAEKIRERRINREFSLAVWNVNEHELERQNQDHIKGLPGSGGLAQGKVKVISGAAEFGKLEKGDILVCSFTDPAWTPLFLLASAVVSDTGGLLSHAAIVAREYRIPAVLGTRVATSCLKDGDRVMVDGFKGTVTVLKDQLVASTT